MKGYALNKKKSSIWKISGAVFLVMLLAGLATACAGRNGQEGQGEEIAQPLEQKLPDAANAEEGNAEAETELEDEPGDTDSGQPEYLKVLIEMGVPVPDREVDFEDLKENVNEDIYAWVYIPDSKIDYPVLQHPIDNYYYLNYNLDGSYGYPGCIYTESYNKRDFSDPLTVMYGHNMKNGTMFAGLHKYEDAEYFKGHPYVYIYTPEKLYVYRIFVSHEYSSEHLLYRQDYTKKSEFEKYINRIMAVRGMNCNRAEDVEVTADSHILVLSTCMADKPDNRYLVQGVLLNED
ncbi:MAG TPA: SrtB family sortase [Lachnospiraceae bacterium]|nr:SrtB family sortase [Lachnospiraceae bacterium]